MGGKAGGGGRGGGARTGGAGGGGTARRTYEGAGANRVNEFAGDSDTKDLQFTVDRLPKSQIALRREFVELGGSVRDRQLAPEYDTSNANLRKAFRNLAYITDNDIKLQIAVNVMDMGRGRNNLQGEIARRARFERLVGQYGDTKKGFKRAYSQLQLEDRQGAFDR